jgi:putative metalloprotease
MGVMKMKKFARSFLVGAVIIIFLSANASLAALEPDSVKSVWAKLAKTAGIDPSAPIAVVDQKEPNAWVSFSLNKYSITVTKGMLKLLDSEDELAGVLAHEIGHIKLNHYGRTVTRSILWGLLFRKVGSSSGIDPLDIGYALAESGFSREQEVEADDYGIELAARAGYDPWGLVRALEKMKEAGYETSPSGFNSHPPTDRRLIRARNKAAEVSTRY